VLELSLCMYVSTFCCRSHKSPSPPSSTEGAELPGIHKFKPIEEEATLLAFRPSDDLQLGVAQQLVNTLSNLSLPKCGGAMVVAMNRDSLYDFV
jgi:hypothetical protein